jgi:hypothetical protein
MQSYRVLAVNPGNDNLPPSIPPSKGNKPKPNPGSDSTKKAKRPQQSGQKGTRQEPVLPEIKSQPIPRPIPPTARSIPSKPDSFVEQTNLTKPPRPLSKRSYPFQLVVILLSLLLLGLVGMGLFLIVSPDGRSIKLFPEPTPDRLNLLAPSSQPTPAVKPSLSTQKN